MNWQEFKQAYPVAALAFLERLIDAGERFPVSCQDSFLATLSGTDAILVTYEFPEGGLWGGGCNLVTGEWY